MPLATEDFEKIGEYIQSHLPEWLPASYESRHSISYPLRLDIELRERMVRVEEGLRHQGEILEQLISHINQRFEQVDKRFEQIDKRFEQVDKRFEEILNQMDKRFEQVDKRFEQMEKRFEQMEKRFEQIDKRFESLTRRIDRFMIWSFALYASSIAAVLGIIKYIN